MRITGGRLGGRLLETVPGRQTRPTSDRARQALFNILTHRQPSLGGARVIDVFAGSGAIGIEAISRGAAFVTFVENDRVAMQCLEENCRKLDISSACDFLPMDARQLPLAEMACDFVFIDPPYRSGLAVDILSILSRQGWLAEKCQIIVEVAAKESFVSPLLDWHIIDERVYGAARIIFLGQENPPYPPFSKGEEYAERESPPFGKGG